jgi:hypothetical protein
MCRIITIILLLFCNTTFAQIPDSLYVQLAKAKEDTNKAKLLNKMARFYLTSKYDSAKKTM